jgi:hypothetical protein
MGRQSPQYGAHSWVRERHERRRKKETNEKGNVLTVFCVCSYCSAGTVGATLLAGKHKQQRIEVDKKTFLDVKFGTKALVFLFAYFFYFFFAKDVRWNIFLSAHTRTRRGSKS